MTFLVNLKIAVNPGVNQGVENLNTLSTVFKISFYKQHLSLCLRQMTCCLFMYGGRAPKGELYNKVCKYVRMLYICFERFSSKLPNGINVDSDFNSNKV